MTKTSLIWVAYFGILVMLIYALAVASRIAVQSHQVKQESAAALKIEEQIRLAIWRMDSLVAPLLMQESNRPHQDYEAFIPIQNFLRSDGDDCPAPLIPSPLLKQQPENIRVHFTCSSLSAIRSPQVPDSQQLVSTVQGLELQTVIENCACEELETAMLSTNVQVGITYDRMQPIWVNDLLILARTVIKDGEPQIQGAWLDWPEMKAALLADIQDVLPEARIEPVDELSSVPPSRRLALLPVQLYPGMVNGLPQIEGSPLKFPLVLTWTSLLVAMCGLGGLLWGMMRLSRRQSDFVSAVSHELRTPLTSFRLNTEMLADGVISDPTRRQSALESLHQESERLSHLVENVMAYAQLEHRGVHAKDETTTEILMTSIEPSLTARAQRDQFELTVDVCSSSRFISHVALVEQILLNLVDNACKYGVSANGDRRIVIRAEDRSIRVQDFGPGIPESELRGLFKPFRKSAQAAAGNSPGVGLGLALSRRLARRLGGDVELEPSPLGSCFLVKL